MNNFDHEELLLRRRLYHIQAATGSLDRITRPESAPFYRGRISNDATGTKSPSSGTPADSSAENSPRLERRSSAFNKNRSGFVTGMHDPRGHESDPEHLSKRSPKMKRNARPRSYSTSAAEARNKLKQKMDFINSKLGQTGQNSKRALPKQTASTFTPVNGFKMHGRRTSLPAFGDHDNNALPNAKDENDSKPVVSKHVTIYVYSTADQKSKGSSMFSSSTPESHLAPNDETTMRKRSHTFNDSLSTQSLLFHNQIQATGNQFETISEDLKSEASDSVSDDSGLPRTSRSSSFSDPKTTVQHRLQHARRKAVQKARQLKERTGDDGIDVRNDEYDLEPTDNDDSDIEYFNTHARARRRGSVFASRDGSDYRDYLLMCHEKFVVPSGISAEATEEENLELCTLPDIDSPPSNNTQPSYAETVVPNHKFKEHVDPSFLRLLRARTPRSYRQLRAASGVLSPNSEEPVDRMTKKQMYEAEMKRIRDQKRQNYVAKERERMKQIEAKMKLFLQKQNPEESKTADDTEAEKDPDVKNESASVQPVHDVGTMGVPFPFCGLPAPTATDGAQHISKWLGLNDD